MFDQRKLTKLDIFNLEKNIIQQWTLLLNFLPTSFSSNYTSKKKKMIKTLAILKTE